MITAYSRKQKSRQLIFQEEVNLRNWLNRYRRTIQEKAQDWGNIIARSIYNP
jgi:hypothetical protein